MRNRRDSTDLSRAATVVAAWLSVPSHSGQRTRSTRCISPARCRRSSASRGRPSSTGPVGRMPCRLDGLSVAFCPENALEPTRTNPGRGQRAVPRERCLYSEFLQLFPILYRDPPEPPPALVGSRAARESVQATRDANRDKPATRALHRRPARTLAFSYSGRLRIDAFESTIRRPILYKLELTSSRTVDTPTRALAPVVGTAVGAILPLVLPSL